MDHREEPAASSLLWPSHFHASGTVFERAISVTVHFPPIHNGQDVHEIVLDRFASVFRYVKVENDGNTVGTERQKSMGRQSPPLPPLLPRHLLSSR
jgi:hypothetical protein